MKLRKCELLRWKKPNFNQWDLTHFSDVTISWHFIDKEIWRSDDISYLLGLKNKKKKKKEWESKKKKKTIMKLRKLYSPSTEHFLQAHCFENLKKMFYLFYDRGVLFFLILTWIQM